MTYYNEFDPYPAAWLRNLIRERHISPLAHGATGRVGRLRAYGNAIVSEVAAEFVKSFMEALENK